MKEFWDDRYDKESFIYGTEPSVYIKKQLPLLKPGKILFPAEGEGRNAVFAAQLGWQVHAFDFSTKGKEKAQKLAQTHHVQIDYRIQSFMNEQYKAEEFDTICMASVHFEPSIKMQMLKRLDSYLKIGGFFIIDAFNKKHRALNKTNPALGGPPDEEMMFSAYEIKLAFSHYEIIELKEELAEIKEGSGHVGKCELIRFIGKKISHSE